LQLFKKKLIILLNYNIINIFLLFIIFRGTSVIYGDGPAGFGEAFFKGILVLFSLSLFLFCLILTIHSYKNKKFDIFPIKVITVILILISYLMIHDACSNNKGYCQNWTIHF